MAEQTPPPDLTRNFQGRTNSARRLPSLRSPRDLTLGGIKKKAFVPNIPTTVRKTKDKDEATSVSVELTENHESRKKRNAGRQRGRGRGRGEVVQSHSIFEQGPSQTPISRPSSHVSYGSGTYKDSKVKAETKYSSAGQVDLDKLMKDDFVINDHLISQDERMLPIKLPIKSDFFSSDVKGEAKSLALKMEVEEKDEASCQSKESPMQIDSVAGGDLKSFPTDAPFFSNVFSPPNTELGELVFIQLPDTLPGDAVDSDQPSSSRQQKDSSSTTSNESSEAGTAEKSEAEIAKRLGLCSLNDFSEGKIGKLQIHKSGRTVLKLGNTSFDMTKGATPGYLQSLVSVSLKDDEGDIVTLGQVHKKIVCVPNIDKLLENS